MPIDPALQKSLSEALARLTPGDLKSFADSAARAVAHQKGAINKILKESFGILAEDQDTRSTTHPVLAGIIRRALREAFEQGASHTAEELLYNLEGLTPSRHPPPDPPVKTTAG